MSVGRYTPPPGANCAVSSDRGLKKGVGAWTLKEKRIYSTPLYKRKGAWWWHGGVQELDTLFFLAD